MATVAERAESAGVSPQEALAILMAGNHRFVAGQAAHPRQDRERRQQVASGQAPFAVVVSCIDSRVPPEIVFDSGLGDVLTVRSGAHTCDEIVLGSIEFGPLTFGTPLIVVLGHRECGAARAAVAAFEEDLWPPGHIEDVVAALRPAYKSIQANPGPDRVDSLVRAHILGTVEYLKAQPVLAGRLAAGRLAIVGGYYDLGSGTVDLVG